MSRRAKQPSKTTPGITTRAKKLRMQSGECGDDMHCSCCQKEIHANADHAILKPCRCNICTRCLTKAHAERGSKALQCPCCKTEATSHRYYSARHPDSEETHYTECQAGDMLPRLGRIVPNDVMVALSETSQQTTEDIPSENRTFRAALPEPSESNCVIGSGSMFKHDDANITVHAIQENLASHSTLFMTADYVRGIRAKQLEEHDSENDSEVPIAEHFVAVMCDGAPCKNYMNIIAEGTYPGLMAFFGGFHTMMKLANCNGELFSNILSTFVGTWRESSNKVDWFALPSDPKQREEETPGHTTSHYAAAAMALHENLDRWPSAVEVNNHMMERAARYPICALALLFLRCEVILKMLRASEKFGKRGSVELFFHCLKLAMPIFAVTHKTEYMQLVCDLLQWYKCASDAEKVIYDNFIYTQVTSFGKSMWADESMEKIIGLVRGAVGRTWRRGTGAKIEQACEAMPINAEHGNVMDGLRTGETGNTKKGTKRKQTSKVHDDSPLIRCLPVIQEMKLWDCSDPPVVDGEELRPGDVRLPNRDEVNPEVLDFFGIGSKRSRDYFQHYNIDHPGKMVRSEKEVPLRRVLSSKKERQSAMEKDVMAATSTKAKQLEVLTKDELLMQIEETRKMLNNRKIDPQIKAEKKSGNKKEKVDRLIELRSILFVMDKEAKEKQKQEIVRQYKADSEGFEDNMRRILAEPMGLYAIHGTVKENSRYNTPVGLLVDKSYTMM